MKIIWSFFSLTLLLGICLITAGCDDSSSGGGNSAPAPKTYLAAAGISVSDADAASSFFQTYIGMTEKTTNTFTDLGSYISNELYFPGSRGSHLIVMENAPADTLPDPIPVKLVFYYDNVTAGTPAAEEKYNAIVSYYGASAADYIVAAPSTTTYNVGISVDVTVAMIKDPNGYILELVSHDYVSYSYFSGIGIGVDSRTDSNTFYTGNFEFVLDETMTVHDGSDELWMVEDILVSKREKGSGLVLMQFDSTNYNNYYLNNGLTPIKLVMYVENKDTFFTDFTGTVVDEPTGVISDIDSYTIQIIDTDVTLQL